LIQSNGRVTELAEGTVPLGLVDNDSYLEAMVQLEPGDLLVLYTDGLTDSENALGETFGAERVLDWARRQWQLPASDVEKSLLQAVTRFCNNRRQADDLTLLVIRFLGDRC
jgi:phosphoserine phosphatase RsbU/P